MIAFLRMRSMVAVVSTCLLVLTMAGCAGSQAFRQGNELLAQGKVEQGLAKLEEAVHADPRNAEYRIALGSQRSSQVNRLVSLGEAHRRDGRLSEAEKAYRQALGIDPQHAMAKQGVDAVLAERRHRLAVAEAEAMFKKGSEGDFVEAMDRLRPVLAEDPKNKEAINLRERINEARAKTPKSADAKLAAAYRKPITLEFRDAPLRAVFDVIAKVSGLNFFFDKDLRPDLKATVLAKNTSIEDAVRLLLVTNQLEQRVLNENTVLIYPATAQKLKDYQPLAVRSFYLANADVKAVSNTIKTLVKTKDLVIDERLGIIMMRDTPEAIRMAERIVALQDLSDPEVMLEVEVLEVKRSRLLDLGVQWPTQLTLAPLQAAGTSLTLEALRNINSATTQASIGSMIISARKEDQDSNILANPRIRVRNKEKAKVLIGDRVPVITTTSTSTGFVSESVTYVDVGLKLEVEPSIYLDEEVAIKINLEVSSLVKEVLSKTGSLSYQIGTRGANTVLRLKDGETQILAGLISDEDRATGNRLPVLGQMPVVGRLFGAQKDDSTRSEILLSITPRVVRSIRRPDLTAAEFESGTESSIGAASLRLGTAEPDRAGAAAARPPTTAAQPPVVVPQSAGATSASNAPPPVSGIPLSDVGGSPIGGVQPAAGSVPAPATPQTSPSGPTQAPQGESAGRQSQGVSVPPPVPVPVGSATGAAPTAPRTAALAPTAVPGGGSVLMAWQTPAQVKVGEQFSAALRVTSQGALRGLPVLAAFDPQSLQVVNVQEGAFFKQSSGATSFSQRVDAAQGRVFATVVRQNPSGVDAGVNGSNTLVVVTFKAMKPGNTRLQLLSASPEPAPAVPMSLPVEQIVRIAP